MSVKQEKFLKDNQFVRNNLLSLLIHIVDKYLADHILEKSLTQFCKIQVFVMIFFLIDECKRWIIFFRGGNYIFIVSEECADRNS